MYTPIEILEEFRKEGSYSVRKINITNKSILSTGKDFLVMNSIVVSIANNGWVACVYPDLYRVSSRHWVYFSWNAKLLSNKYDQVKIKKGKLVIQEGEIKTGLLLLEFISLMKQPVDNYSFENYDKSCNIMRQLGWGKILNYPFYPHNTEEGLELYSLYGPVIFKDTNYVPIKLTASNVYYFPEATNYLTDEEIERINRDKFISVGNEGVKLVVEHEKYRYIDIIIKSFIKIIGVRYQKNWDVIDSEAFIRDPLYSPKASSMNHLIPDYTDAHTMKNNIGAVQYKKTHVGGNNG